MVLNCHYDYLIEKIGHDGSEILWPHLPEPVCYKAFHIEEIQYVALGFGVILTPFTKAFEYAPNDEELPLAKYDFTTPFAAMLMKYDGILLGQWKRGSPHAVAWNAAERLIYDPEGNIYSEVDSFECDQFYAAVRVG